MPSFCFNADWLLLWLALYIELHLIIILSTVPLIADQWVVNDKVLYFVIYQEVFPTINAIFHWTLTPCCYVWRCWEFWWPLWTPDRSTLTVWWGYMRVNFKLGLRSDDKQEKVREGKWSSHCSYVLHDRKGNNVLCLFHVLSHTSINRKVSYF